MLATLALCAGLLLTAAEPEQPTEKNPPAPAVQAENSRLPRQKRPKKPPRRPRAGRRAKPTPKTARNRPTSRWKTPSQGSPRRQGIAADRGERGFLHQQRAGAVRPPAAGSGRNPDGHRPRALLLDDAVPHLPAYAPRGGREHRHGPAQQPGRASLVDEFVRTSGEHFESGLSADRRRRLSHRKRHHLLGAAVLAVMRPANH